MKSKQVTAHQLFKKAASKNASKFIHWLDKNNIAFEFEDVDNIMDYNEGFVNITVECIDEVDGVALLFVDGELDHMTSQIPDTDEIIFQTKLQKD
jgi:hypothetical protein